MPIEIEPGSPVPLGASYNGKGVNFALFMQEPKKIKLVVQAIDNQSLIFEHEIEQFSGQIGHIFLSGLPDSFIYFYQLDNERILDPYAKGLITPHDWSDTTPYQPKGYFSNKTEFDWESDKRPDIKNEDLIIYEMHIRGFTEDPSSEVKSPGTYLGLIEKIDYLKSLGINAVEVLPVNEFNPHEYPNPASPFFGKIMQYWGYSAVSYFTLMNRYASGKEYDAAVKEFKQMVKKLHEAGIEVILDMVFNHTAEFGQGTSFEKLGKETYYILDEKGEHTNFTGCGNTLNCNQPVVIELILASLRYLVTEMHVDGFRFDLAPIFYRGTDGAPLALPPILEFITKDPVLQNIKLIAEPWDASGLQKSGSFKELSRWSEWNAYYRDGVRKFIMGNPEAKKEFATRIAGSDDLYSKESPQKSINFVTCHDGFSLNDLVSYNGKHNLANGEENRDGTDNNLSWNCGAEGDTNDPGIIDLRLRQMRNFHLALMLSQGIPMIRMGDEYGHTKQGNNNTWCQDNALNWFQWHKLTEKEEFHRFYSGLIHFRNENSFLKQTGFLSPDVLEWHGKVPSEPNFDSNEAFLAFTLKDPQNGQELYAAFNARNEPATVQFPKCPEGKIWAWIANSSTPLSKDYYEKEKKLETCSGESFEMLPYSSLALYSTVTKH